MKLLDYKKTEKLFKECKIPLIETGVVKNRNDVLSFIKRFGLPVVIKVFSPSLLHRTEKGLVKICFSREEGVRVFSEMKRKMKEKPGMLVLIQKKGQGVELIIGMKRDAVFGPIVMFGLGGVFVEVLEDISFGIAPLSMKEAGEMIKSVKAYKILKGCRSSNKQKNEAYKKRINELSDILVKISRFSRKHPEIKAIDMNPIFFNEKGVFVADPKLYVE